MMIHFKLHFIIFVFNNKIAIKYNKIKSNMNAFIIIIIIIICMYICASIELYFSNIYINSVDIFCIKVAFMLLYSYL